MGIMGSDYGNEGVRGSCGGRFDSNFYIFTVLSLFLSNLIDMVEEYNLALYFTFTKATVTKC